MNGKKLSRYWLARMVDYASALNSNATKEDVKKVSGTQLKTALT